MEPGDTSVMLFERGVLEKLGSDLPVGAVLVGRYKIQVEIGRGGMGVVYRCTDLKCNTTVAVKVLLVDTHHHFMLERMANEAAILVFLRHPNLVEVHDMGTDPETHIHYAAMEYAPFGSLGQLVDVHGPLDGQQTANVGVQVCCALDLLHSRGILHRDVKPTNLLRAEDGRVLLTDLGISKIPDASFDDTDADQVMGSFAYMAPEQRLGMDEVTPQSDVYAVGTTLFKLCSGKTPMDIFAHPRTGDRWLAVPRPLRGPLYWATRFEQKDRPASAKDLGKALAEHAAPELFERQPHLREWLDH